MSDEINQILCEANLQGTGDSGCVTDLTIAAKVFLFKEDINFATLSVALLEASWDALIQSGDIIPLPLIHATENADEEETIDKGNTGQSHKVKEAVGNNTYNLINTPGLHARIRSYNNFNGGYVVVDKNKNVLMYTADGTTLDAPGVGLISVGIQKASDGSVGRYTPIMIEDVDSTQYNDSPAVFKPSWNILGKNGLLATRLVFVSGSATEIIVDLTVYDNGAAVSSMEVAGDWILTDGQTVTSATESLTIPGRYTIAGIGLVTGTLNLADPSVLSVDGYQSTGAIVVTVT